jgi:multidrug resistance efflux pump
MPPAPRFSSLLWLLGLALLVASAAGTAWLLKPTGPAPAAPQENEDEVAWGDGHVDALNGVRALAPAQPGRVVAVAVRENDHVETDAELFRVDDRLARLHVEEAEAAAKGARAQLELAQVLPEQHTRKLEQQGAAVRAAREVWEIARQESKRLEEQDRNFRVNAATLEAARARVKQAKALLESEESRLEELRSHGRDPELALRRARAEVEAAEARVRTARQALEGCTLRAPQAGTVLRLEVGVGDSIPVQPLRPPLLFAPDEELIVRAEVAQEFAADVKEGLAATVQDDAPLGPHTWAGKVTRVSKWFARRRSVLLEPGQVNDERTLECLIALPKGVPLRIGQRVHVAIRKGPAP